MFVVHSCLMSVTCCIQVAQAAGVDVMSESETKPRQPWASTLAILSDFNTTFVHDTLQDLAEGLVGTGKAEGGATGEGGEEECAVPAPEQPAGKGSR